MAVSVAMRFHLVAGSGMLSISIGLNALSTHDACTAAFLALAAIIGFLLSSIRTLHRISWLAWLGLVCILSSIFVVTIAPRHFTWALMVCQGAVTAVYIAIGCMVYYFCGPYVATPALGSAGVTVKKIAYVLALPGLIAAITLVIHFVAKYTIVRILRGCKHLASNSAIHWGTWLSCTLGTTIIAFLIVSGIPVFGGLVSLIGALLGTLLSFQPMGCMWLYDKWTEGRRNPSLRWALMETFLMIGDTYGSVVGIIDSYKASGGSVPWSCADNSNSV
ncbi:hypothetical protein B0T10DRAFT_530110 [Thelonectria olida]|uniref:Amino acid transporter transmembrane domain-containing protein n=1 Tax=Thelonectria olida TaxID=1576542 RepID=A0A9P8W2X6_9HYPO|nr:hypothetical protein B0T10DRAFT_530110 [Thelonectria olida]